MSQGSYPHRLVGGPPRAQRRTPRPDVVFSASSPPLPPGVPSPRPMPHRFGRISGSVVRMVGAIGPAYRVKSLEGPVREPCGRRAGNTVQGTWANAVGPNPPQAPTRPMLCWCPVNRWMDRGVYGDHLQSCSCVLRGVCPPTRRTRLCGGRAGEEVEVEAGGTDRQVGRQGTLHACAQHAWINTKVPSPPGGS
jgi:hypothetical protein